VHHSPRRYHTLPQPFGDERIEPVQRTLLEMAAKLEQRPGLIYLIVKNKSNKPFTVETISVKNPRFVIITSLAPEEKRVLADGSSLSVGYNISATNEVLPGKQLIMFELLLEQAGREQTITASHPITVGVLGESEILTLLQLPSLLFLPGFLIVLTWQFLWSVFKPLNINFPLEAKTPQFWLFAIGLSFIMLLVYPPITGMRPIAGSLTTGPRNYLVGYGLLDFALIWMISMTLAIVTFVIAFGGYNLVLALIKWGAGLLNRFRQWQVREKTPSQDDMPITILRKLDRQGLGVALNVVEAPILGATRRAFLLERWREDQKEFWVGPAIMVKWSDTAEAGLQQRVEELLEQKQSAAMLADFLEKSQGDGDLSVSWGGEKPFERPVQAKKEEINFISPPPARIIQWE
jgi:hypothetical protein